MDEHSEDNEKRERVLLRPWLENLIESGSILGLEWMDNTKTMFKVPWKHRSKKTWSLRHSSIFLEWAKNTGRWSEGDPEPNYAQLKTRLRCAFNKAPDIEEMKELHRTKSEEPYKVYKFIPRKESKLYPFGRRPIRKTTVPITVRKRRYLISRISSACMGASGARRSTSLLDGSSGTLLNVKQEKEDISPDVYKESIAEENFSSHRWSQWLPERDQMLSTDEGNAWPNVFYHEAREPNINRILPLIVEEANTSVFPGFDPDLPCMSHDWKSEARIPSLMPEIHGDQVSLLRESAGISANGVSKLLQDGAVPVSVGFPVGHKVLPSNSLSPEKLEYLHHWREKSSAVYASSRGAHSTRNDSFAAEHDNCILPRDNADAINRSSSDTKQPFLDRRSASPICWTRSLPDNKVESLNRSPEGFVEKLPLSSPAALTCEPVAAKSLNRIPAARLFPLKHRISMSQSAMERQKSPETTPSVLSEPRLNAVVKPNAFAQPRVAVATPYDRNSGVDDEQRDAVESAPLNAVQEFSKSSPDALATVTSSPEPGIIDLRTRGSSGDLKNSDSKVLDLTKKMVVTPFERNSQASSFGPGFKSVTSDTEKEVDESLLSIDSALPPSELSEIVKFKAEYKRKKQSIVTKTMLLVEKEKELKAREKQLAAREEALFWKESYLHKVMAGVDAGLISVNRNNSLSSFGTVTENRRPLDSVRSSEFCSASLRSISPPSIPVFPPQNSALLMSELIAARHQLPVMAKSERLNLIPNYQISPVAGKNILPLNPPSSILRYPPTSLAAPFYATQLRTSDGLYGAALPPFERGVNNKRDEFSCEREADVALGDADPSRKNHPARKFESDTVLSVAAAQDSSNRSTMLTRKRGRPKGSKNKVKLQKAASDCFSMLPQMPPLLVIQSPKEQQVSESARQHLHSVGRNLNQISSCVSEDSFPQATNSSANFSGRYAPNRILPPVTGNSGVFANQLPAISKRYNIPAAETGISISSPSSVPNLLDHVSNKDTMPDTVRQLLVSASKPVSTILPPLSPAKSPEEFSHTTTTHAVDLCNELPSGDDNRTTTSVC